MGKNKSQSAWDIAIEAENALLGGENEHAVNCWEAIADMTGDHELKHLADQMLYAFDYEQINIAHQARDRACQLAKPPCMYDSLEDVVYDADSLWHADHPQRAAELWKRAAELSDDEHYSQMALKAAKLIDEAADGYGDELLDIVDELV